MESEYEKAQRQFYESLSALRWIRMALFFAIISFPINIISLFMAVDKNPHSNAMMILAVGCIVLSFYCRWMSHISAPKEWKEYRRDKTR